MNTKQVKLIMKKVSKAGQVASLILLSIAVLFFLGSAGIFFAQKKLLQTKAMIAADAGGMYLNSQIGSYAHYLSCMYIDCKCHKTKRRWAMIFAVALAVVAVATAAVAGLQALALISVGIKTAALVKAAIVIGSTAVSLGVSDEIQVQKGVKALNKQFKKLASTSVKEYYKWSTIQYTATMLADSGAIAGLLEDIKTRIESGNAGRRRRNLYHLAEAIANDLLDAYYDTIGPYSSHYYLPTSAWDFPILLNAIDEWDSLVGGRVVNHSFYRETDSELGYSHTLSSTNYIRYVIFRNPYPDDTGDDLSLRGLMQDLRSGNIDGINALLSIRDFEPCNPNEEDCFDEEDFFTELDRVKVALRNMRENINRYDLNSYGPLQISDQCDWYWSYDPCIDYHRLPYETLQEISWHHNPMMSRGDYQQMKNDLISQINHAIHTIDSFLSRVNSIFNKYGSELNYWFGPVNYDYLYSWSDSLGRRHSLLVKVRFKLPRIKVKKKLFKVKIKLKRCHQTMRIEACRNGFCYGSRVHYAADSGNGPTTNAWWIDGY